MQVKPENGPDFENVWKNRESKLLEMPDFIRFALLRGDEEGMEHAELQQICIMRLSGMYCVTTLAHQITFWYTRRR